MKIALTPIIPARINLPGQLARRGGSFQYTAIDNNFAMQFDGVESYFQGSDITSLDNASAFSISFWFKPFTLTATQRIMSKYTDSNNRTSLSLFSTSFNINISRGGLQTGEVAYPNESPAPWKHIAVVFDGSKTGNSNRVKCWFNGVAQTINFATSTIPALTANTSGKTFNVGALDTGTTILNPVNGKLDEVAVWGGTALSEETIQAIYNTTIDNPGKVADLSQTPEGEPAAWYRMGD